MLTDETHDKLQQTIKTIEINFERLDFAKSKFNKFIPLTEEKYYSFEPETISFIDQYIFRFSKCQDLIGEKLFRLVLICLEENIEHVSFIDILNKLEKLGIFDSKTEWIELRKLRNIVSHEYPVLDNETVSALNLLFKSGISLKNIYNKCLKILKENNIN